MTRFLANLPIRLKFLLVPLLGMALIAGLGVFVLVALHEDQRRLEPIIATDLTRLRDSSAVFQAFSTNHVSFVNLLAEALRLEIDEGDFYARGRAHIRAVNRNLDALAGFAGRLDAGTQEHRAILDLSQQMRRYRDQIGETVLIASVDLDLIARFMLEANSSFEAANEKFLSVVDSLQVRGHDELVQADRQLRLTVYAVAAVLVGVLALMALFALLLSKHFTRDLKDTIRLMDQVSRGDLDAAPSLTNRRDEFGAVNDAIEVFRQVLRDRKAVERYLKKQIHERVEAEHSLRLSEERFRGLFEDNPLMLMSVDEDGRIVSINRRGATLLGEEMASIVGAPAEASVEPDDRPQAAELLSRCRSEPDTPHQCTLRRRRGDGEVVWLRESGREIREDGRSLVLLACEDVTETQRLTETISYQATHDRLTGLVNRWEFERRLGNLIDTARKTHTEHLLCYLDLDQFKVINDTCGHGAGDQLLRELSEMLAQRFRSRDTLARLGGDEFGILLEHCAQADGWRAVRGLLSAIQAFRFRWDGREFSVGASIGMIAINELSPDPEGLLADADAACYAAKDAGRNRIHVHSADDDSMRQRRGEMLWASRIPQALEEQRFRLYYQTIEPTGVDRDGPLHVELLLRLLGDDGEAVAPGVFLPAAERYGLMTRLDRWVIAAAMDGLARAQASGVGIGTCAINLSGQSLGDVDIGDYILAQARRTGVPLQRVCFEITETAAVTNLDRARALIARLKAEGARFALDDFGTGVSSFAYLRELPVDYLKIDGVFVRDIASDAVARAMVQSIHDVATVLAMETVAEFVESAQVMAVLREIGVQHAQGYHLSRPAPAEDLFDRVLRVVDAAG